MQYCSAAPVTKFIPYTESPLSRCGSESHRYCDLYLNLSSPGTKRGAASADGHAEMGEQSLCEYRVDDIRVPSWLAYSANHMWLNIDSDGSCHLGIDDFLAKVLGRVEKLSFLPAKMGGRPSVVLTARGIDLQLMFPNYLVLTASNIGLRANADKLTSDPYTLGWLFEGREAGISPLEPSIAADSGMLRGNQAIAWMESEVARLSEFIRDQTFTPAKTGDRLMTDGGTFIRGLIRHLSRDQVLTLFNEFFSPFAGWRK